MSNDEVAELGKLMVPSAASIVTVENLWRIMNVITKIGRTFQKEDIVNHPDSPYTDKVAIGRILSYLKYLGFITEKREKVEAKDGAQFVQKFTITETANKLYYLLQDGRREEMMKEWHDLMEKHDLYRIVQNELLSQTKKATIRELQDVIWKAYGGKHQSSFYKEGAEFIAELLDNARLVEYDKANGYISQIEVGETDLKTKFEIKHTSKSLAAPVGPDYVEFSYEGLYLKIKLDEKRLELAKGILNLLENQLQLKKPKNKVGKAEVE